MNRPRGNPAWWLPALAGLTLAAFAMRVASAAVQDLRSDEAFSALLVADGLRRIVPNMIAAGDPHPPLHYVVLALWRALAGDSELALRWPSIVAGTLVVPLTAQLGRRATRPAAAWLAAALLAVSQAQIWLSHDVRSQYTFALLFGLLATAALGAALDRVDRGRPARATVHAYRRPGARSTVARRKAAADDADLGHQSVKSASSVAGLLPSRGNSERLPARRFWLAYALAALLTMLSHYYGVFVLLAHGVWVGRRPGPAPWAALRRWVAAGTLAALAYTPWLVLLYRTTVTRQLSEANAVGAGEHAWAILRELVTGTLFSAPWQAAPVAVALLLLGVGAAVGRPATARSRLFLLVWFLLTAIGIYLVRLRRPTFNPFYISVAVPAFWILVAAGGAALWRARTASPAADRVRRLVVAVAFIGLLAANGTALQRYWFEPDVYQRRLGYREIGALLAAEARPGDVFVAHAPDPSLTYYLSRAPLPTVLQPGQPGMTAAEIEADLRALAGEFDRLWFVPAVPELSFDPTNYVPGWLAGNLIHAARLEIGRLTLHAYRPPAAAGDVVRPVGLDARGAIRLSGAVLLVDGRPVTAPVARPGAALEVSLLWQALADGDEPYAVFVHLLDAEGRLLAQSDGTPVFGTRPTDGWRAGETLIDIHTLTVPADASGSVQLVAGLYRRDDLTRVPFGDGQTAIELARWQIGEAGR